ncbi:hypothetical protein KCU83_g4185, partial [Aureobasidium melanogenum]
MLPAHPKALPEFPPSFLRGSLTFSATAKISEETRLKKTVRKGFQGLVTVIAGASKKEFTVHKDLLSFYSDYFRAAFNGSFVEATDKKIELHDVEPEVFNNFHAWLYTRKLASNSDEPMSWNYLVDLCIFGDRFHVPMLQNCAMDEIDARIMIEELAHDTYIGDEEGSVMAAEYEKFFTIEILQDLVKELDAARKNKLPYDKWPKRDKCFFHVHGKDEHC